MSAYDPNDPQQQDPFLNPALRFVLIGIALITLYIFLTGFHL